MEQKSFDFIRLEASPITLQMSKEHQQQLIDLMESLIIHVFQLPKDKDSENDNATKS